MESNAGTQSGLRLDLTHLCEISGNDTVTMREVIDVFLEHAPALMGELRDHNEARDGAGLRRVAHKLKPMLAYVGMTSLHARAVQIEQAEIAAANWEQFAELVRSVTTDFEPARLELIAYRATLGD